jgi:hypothetical protein
MKYGLRFPELQTVNIQTANISDAYGIKVPVKVLGFLADTLKEPNSATARASMHRLCRSWYQSTGHLLQKCTSFAQAMPHCIMCLCIHDMWGEHAIQVKGS